MYKRSFLFFSLLVAGSVFGLQVQFVSDNETVAAKIASQDITRILVAGDRIKNVKGVKGAYTRENDETSGEIYIQPTSFYQDRAFTLLVETEQGRHFTLLLNPISVPSDTLMLVPKGLGRKQMVRLEKSSDYQLMLIHLVRDFSNNVVPEGYVVRQVEEDRKYALGHVANLKLKTIYEGENLQGEIYELINTQSVPITLQEQSFYKVGTKAISLESATVSPYARVKIIRVTGHA